LKRKNNLRTKLVLTELASHPRVQWTRQRVVVDRLLILSGGSLQRRRLLVRVDHDLVMVSRRRRDDGLLLLLLLLVVVRAQVAEVRLLLLLVVRLWRRRRMVVLLLLVMVVASGRHLLLLLLLVVVGHVDHVGGAARFDETVGNRGLELARGIHDGRVAVHGHLAHATATAAAASDQATADGRFGPAVAVHGRLVVVVVVAGRSGRLPDFHPVVGREPRVRHALGRLSADGGPDVVVRWYALPGGRVARRVVYVVLLTVVVVVHDHATTAAAPAADNSADAAKHASTTAAASDEASAGPSASAVPHVGRHVRVGKVRAHVQQVAAVALHFAGR